MCEGELEERVAVLPDVGEAVKLEVDLESFRGFLSEWARCFITGRAAADI